MITNLDIDDDLAALLETAAKARGVSLREFIRSTLRQAANSPLPAGVPVRFTQRTHDFGTHIESPWTVLADIESEEYLRKYNRK